MALGCLITEVPLNPLPEHVVCGWWLRWAVTADTPAATMSAGEHKDREGRLLPELNLLPQSPAPAQWAWPPPQLQQPSLFRCSPQPPSLGPDLVLNHVQGG